MFLLPTIAALFLGGLRVYEGFEDIGVYDRAEQRIALSQKVAATVDELQSERETMSAWIVSGRPQGRGELDDQIARSDRAATTLRDAPEVEGIDDPVTTALFGQATARLDGLGQLRVSANDASFAALAALESYAGVIDALLAVSDEFGADVTDKGLQDRHDALAALSHAKEFSAQQNAFLRNAAIRGSFEPAELSSINSAEANLVSQIDAFNNVATSQARQDYANTITGELVSRRFQYQQLALLRAEAKINVAIDPGAVAQSSAATLNLISQVENRLLDEAGSYTGDLAGSEQRTLIFVSAGILAGLLVALTLMFVVARSMLVPLRSLRTNALEVAERHLPEAVEKIMSESDPKAAAERAIDPVPVHTTEEIGQVARAFDVVNAQAVRLAAEQALLRENVNGIFVNLSRRSQRLVERQLGVIDRLEADEQDPDHLASLFELDHLATRLRRNGESLLVLSGAGLTKSVSRPVPAVEVIGAAVSEIEQYARVEVGQVPEVSVQGRAIQDLVHLLAELLDNATYFSEPETRVTMRAAVTRKRSLAIQITDKGVGMSEEDIEEANKRLADPPAFDVSVTRRMGLYVVARLAKRHGIEVRLRDNEEIDNGIIARIVVPAELLVATPAAQSLGGPPSQPRIPAQAPMLPPTPTQSSLPPITPVYQQQKPEPPTETWTPAPPPPTPAETSMATNGLTPLAQPISLDDLVAGSPNAAFTSRPTDAPLPTSYPVSQQLPVRQVPAPPPPPAPPAAEPAAQEDFGFPTEEPDQPGTDYSDYEALAKQPADDDPDAPTRRLPIYQSVMSRWFSEVEDELDERPPASSSAPASSELAGPAPETDRSREADRSREPSAEAEPSALPKRVPAEPEQSGFPKRTPDPEAEPEPEVAQEAPAVPEQPTSTPQPEYTEGPPPKPRPVVASTWQSASDQGWQAAQALLETRNEEVTEAGLPKRVPNAYLVPGSVNAPEQDAFRDTSVGQPSPSAISRSAAAARSRMASFQRGFTTGRHALSESSAEPGSYPGAGNSRTEQGTREWQ